MPQWLPVEDEQKAGGDDENRLVEWSGHGKKSQYDEPAKRTRDLAVTDENLDRPDGPPNE